MKAPAMRTGRAPQGEAFAFVFMADTVARRVRAVDDLAGNATAAEPALPESTPMGVFQRPTATTGWRSWATTIDHKKIGKMYGFMSIMFFIIGGVEALLIRTQLATPNGTLLSAQVYNEVLTMLSRQDLVRGLDDRVGELCIETTGLLVSDRSGALDSNYCFDKRARRLESADREVLHGAQRLDTIQSIRRNLELAKRIFFNSCVRCHFTNAWFRRGLFVPCR